jgi:glycine/D-amino acid oxidase-like deaminating enzyme
MTPSDNGGPSFWHRQLGGPPSARPPLVTSVDADVCIVGAGYTGLWTAWALKTSDPSLRVVVLEAAFAGYGASGRNGGWLSGLMPGSRTILASGPGGRPAVLHLQRQLNETVRFVESWCLDRGVDADLVRSGSLAVATTPTQWARLRSALEEDRTWGIGPEDAWLVSAAELAGRVRIAGARGAVFTPHCARIQPAKLVRALAGAAEEAGVEIYESTPVRSLAPGLAVTPGGSVRARFVLRCTEGYTAGLGQRRALLPMNSSMVVTEPLPASVWDEIGWAGCETIRDDAHAYAYLQRTADGRIAIGGRGVPYRFGSRTDADGLVGPTTVDALWSTLVRLFPAVDGARMPIAHSWCGVLGVSRDWCATVTLDRASGFGWAGGYVGDGVAASCLAGRALADLVLGHETERTRIPWVDRRAPAWEPEPFRWLGVRSIYGLYRAADRLERRAASVDEGSGSGRRTAWAARTLTWAADRVSGRP